MAAIGACIYPFDYSMEFDTRDTGYRYGYATAHFTHVIQWSRTPLMESK